MSRPSHFPDRMPRLGTAAGALVTMPTGSAALTLMAIAVVVAVSVVSLVVLVAVLGRGARHRAALTVLRVLLGGRIRSGTDQMTAHAGHPAPLPHAVHRSIVVVDVEGFSDARRTNPNQVAIRDGLYRAMRAAFDHTGIPWADCDHEDRGDGVFVLIPAGVPKGLLVELLPSALVRALQRHNSTHQDQERSGCGWRCMPERSATTVMVPRQRRSTWRSGCWMQARSRPLWLPPQASWRSSPRHGSSRRS